MNKKPGETSAGLSGLNESLFTELGRERMTSIFLQREISHLNGVVSQQAERINELKETVARLQKQMGSHGNKGAASGYQPEPEE